jgi:hypothetical protein
MSVERPLPATMVGRRNRRVLRREGLQRARRSPTSASTRPPYGGQPHDQGLAGQRGRYRAMMLFCGFSCAGAPYLPPKAKLLHIVGTRCRHNRWMAMKVRDASCAPIDRAGFRWVFASAGLVALSLVGCSTIQSSIEPSTWMVDSGRYTYYHCDVLLAQLKAIQQHRKELFNLMARASEGGGGALIGTMTYRPDYEKTFAEEKVLRHAAGEKNCNLPPPAPAEAPTAAAYPAPTAPAAPPTHTGDHGIH